MRNWIGLGLGGLGVLGAVVVLAPSAVAQESSAPPAPEAAPQAGSAEERDTAEDSGTAVSESDQLAQRHFETGRAYFDRGQYEDALQEFDQAYALSQRSALLYNLYLSHERLGHIAEAIASLEGFLAARAEPEPNLEARLESLRQRLEAQQADEAAQADAHEEPAPDADPPTDAGSGIGTPALVSFVAAGVGVAAFGVFGGLALGEDSELASTCGADAGALCEDDDLSTLQTLTLAADIGLGLALVGAVTGLILLLTGGEAESGGDSLAVGLGPRGASLRVGF